MKNFTKLAMLALFFLQSCLWYGDEVDDVAEGPVHYSNYEPVHLSRAVLENSISLSEPRPIDTAGKIYIKDNLLFINDQRKGFHVFDNSNPQSPVKIKFLEAPGSTDLAIRESVLYINQATDLVSARLDANLSSVSVTKRVKEVFPEVVSPDGFYPFGVPENSVVVDWKLKPE